jgi:hypothetical protein
MNFTSAAVCPTFDRSVARSVLMVCVSWPGAPGCMMRVPVEDPPPAVLQDTNAIVNSSTTARREKPCVGT